MTPVTRCLIGTSAVIYALAATAANASTSAAPIENSSFYSLYGGTPYWSDEPSTVGFFDKANIDFSSPDGNYSGINLQGLSQLDTESILFKNGVVVAGRASYAEMITGVAITFTNTNSSRVVRPVVTSTLLAAGLGLYVTNELRSFNAVVPPGTCSSAALLNCGVATGNTYYDPSHWANSWASFEFDVSVGGTSIYSLNGRLGTDADGNFYEDMDAARATLGGFTKITDPTNPFALSYKWDDTAVKIALPDPLDPGQSVTAIYSIRTTVQIGATNDGSTSISDGRFLHESQIAYSAFGDPTGGKSPIGTSRSALPDTGFKGIGPPESFLNLSTFGSFSFPGSTIEIDSVTGQPVLVSTPVEEFNPDTGEYELVAKVAGQTFIPAVTGVPEPASWVMLIAGFGMTGTALRRRRMPTI